MSKRKSFFDVTSSDTDYDVSGRPINENELPSYFIYESIDILTEDGGFFSSLGNAGKELWNKFVNIVGSETKTIGTQQEVVGDLGNKIKALGDWMNNNKQITAAGLAGAGLLGTYYLFKKFTNKKKLDNNDRQMADKIDKMDASKLKQLQM